MEQTTILTTDILTSLSAHISVIDQAGEIVSVNPAWERFGENNGAALHPDTCGVGNNYLAVCDRAARQGDAYAHLAYNGIQGVLTGIREEFYMEYPCHSPLASRWFAMRVTPLRPGKGAVISHENITERKLAEQNLEKYAEELQRSNQALREFAYIASHDLKEPLRKIMTFGNRVLDLEQGQLSSKGEDYLHRMQDAAGRMQRLIDGLLNLSQISTDLRPFSPVDLNEIAQEVVTDLDLLIQEHQAQVIVAPLPVIEGDPILLRQLFQNLIANSLKFSREEAKPVIHIEAKEAWREESLYKVSLLFRDNGIGFDPKYEPQIFNLFQRLNGRRYEGSGIGLAVCKQIAQRHQGSISAFGRPGEGATFIVTLPVRRDDDYQPDW